MQPEQWDQEFSSVGQENVSTSDDTSGYLSETASEEIKSATRALREAAAALTRAVGQGMAGVGSEVTREIATSLATAAGEVTQEFATARSNTRSAKAERTRAQLLASAMRLFAERGYEGASMADIAKDAGFTKGALYANFASKEELFVTLIREENERHDAAAGNQPINLREDPVQEDLTGVILSLESYLLALRSPSARAALLPMALKQFEDMAREVHRTRTGEEGEATLEDRDITMALAAHYTFGGIMAQLLPEEYGVPGAAERLNQRLLAPERPAGAPASSST